MIHLDNLHVVVGSFTLKELNLTIDDHEYFMILGPTGAGKTVLLESIAGLNPVKSGSIWLNGKNISNLKPEKREVSLVYQDHALFPHLSVSENILFGLKMRRKSVKEMRGVLNWLTELLDIANLLDRRPETLSGGERQKVSLARALSTSPQVLLLDEPLSALDPETREEVQEELQNLHGALKNTIVHVTHDFQEAMALGDRVAVIGEGRLKQVGTPEQIFRTPESVFVARFALVRNI
ncbi:MAG: ATP-binding cassette domain-containing protein, partial [Dehalococcoidales bacterium]|nr:ATP-binding cassette domain-containing protein [Dehalococcoidales bacterium]